MCTLLYCIYSSAQIWYNGSDFVQIIIYEFLVFGFQTICCTRFYYWYGGGRVPEGPKGAFKAQLWASGLNPPILVLNLMKSVFSNFRICTRFSITGSKYYEDIMYKCQNLYSVFHRYSVMYLLNSYFRICTQFSITGTQLCNYF